MPEYPLCTGRIQLSNPLGPHRFVRETGKRGGSGRKSKHPEDSKWVSLGLSEKKAVSTALALSDPGPFRQSNRCEGNQTEFYLSEANDGEIREYPKFPPFNLPIFKCRY